MSTRYLSVKEVATILNISIKTVYKKRGIIPGYFNLGGMHFFDEEEFRSGLKKLINQSKSITSVSHQTHDKHGLMK